MAFCSKCGAELPEGAKTCAKCGTAVPNAADPNNNAAANSGLVPIITDVPKPESKFTGGAFANFFMVLLCAIVSIITVGLAAPSMICWRQRWIAKHTYIDGKHLEFYGKGGKLLGRFILWIFLSVITLGIYSFFMAVKLEKWIDTQTHFAGYTPVEGKESSSDFDGKGGAYFGVCLLTAFVTIITLSFGLYWATCYKKRWFAKHTVIDGKRIEFDGKAGQLFGKTLLWGLLTVITIGIFSFWFAVKKMNWFVSHTHVVKGAASAGVVAV